MAYQMQWPAFPSQSLTANGGAGGLVQIANTDGLYVLQEVVLANNAGLSSRYQVLEVVGPTSFYVGTVGQLDKRYAANGADVSAFTTATASTVTAVQQNKKLPSPNSVMQAAFEAEPILALRNTLVDARGNPLYAKGSLAALRASTVLTNAYVASASLDTRHANAVVVLSQLTKGSLTNIMLRFDVSDDNATWFPAEIVGNGAVTAAGDEAQTPELAKVHVLAPATVANYTHVIHPKTGGALAKYFRARVLGTGTVTSSLAKIDAYACIV